jgi:elongation factor P
VKYIVEGGSITLATYNGEVIGTELPAAVELTIAETEPGVQGDRVSGARKPATLETGLVVQVPLFVNPGARIKVDTRSAEYLTRA